jgi:hypothetical protein
MGNKTITVRFEPQLYSMIKNHELNASEIIRHGVRLFFQQEASAQQMPGGTQSETESVGQNTPQISAPSATMDKTSPPSFPSEKLCRSIDETLQLMDKLKWEIDQLDQDLYSWMTSYDTTTRHEDKYKTVHENIDALKPRW